MVRAKKKASSVGAAPTAADPIRPSSSTTVKKKAPVKTAGVETPASQIVKDLDGLKKALDEAVLSFCLRVNDHLASVQKSLKSPAPAPKVKLKDVRRLLDSLKLKPSKGRVKDLVRIAKLAKILDDVFSDE